MGVRVNLIRCFRKYMQNGDTRSSFPLLGIFFKVRSEEILLALLLSSLLLPPQKIYKKFKILNGPTLFRAKWEIGDK